MADGPGPGPSVAFTSDTPPPPSKQEPERYREWLSAPGTGPHDDLLVVHLSSVPLTELRRMDSALDPNRPKVTSRLRSCRLKRSGSLEGETRIFRGR